MAPSTRWSSPGQTDHQATKSHCVGRGTGTTITFTPDPTIFPKTDFDPELIRQRLEITSFLHRGVRVHFVDETTGKKESFFHEQGIVDYLGKVLTQRNARPIHDAPFTVRKDGDERIEIALQWTESTDEHVRSYCNGIPTASGGTHENGFRSGLGKAVRNYFETLTSFRAVSKSVMRTFAKVWWRFCRCLSPILNFKVKPRIV